MDAESAAGRAGLTIHRASAPSNDDLSVPSRMNIVFTQTADAEKYLEMVLATSRTARRYCASHGFDYECYLGIKRGYWPWQASFNRIYMLEELIRRGRHDWAVYLDADAYVADLDFDLPAYLEPRSEFAAILTPSKATDHWWDINDGVMLLNLRHPKAAGLVEAWRMAFEAIPDATLREQTNWSNPDDQEMIQWFLRDNEAEMRSVVELAPATLINTLNASFIRQFVRAHAPDLKSRTEAVKIYVDEVLGSHKEERQTREAQRRDEIQQLITALYLIVLRRGPDEMGMVYYTDLFQHLGMSAGAQRLVADALRSDEYRQMVLAPAGREAQNEPAPELVEAGMIAASGPR